MTAPRRTARRKRNLMIRLAEHQDNECFLCERPMLFLQPGERHQNETGNGGEYASLHHVVPRSLGGVNRLHNLVVAHRQCNSIAGKRPPTEEEIARLSALNERRAEMLVEIQGIIATTSFGQETPASIYLVDLLEELDGHEAIKVRRMVTATISRLTGELAALDCVQDRRMWDRLTLLVLNDAIERSKVLDAYNPIGNATRSVMRTFLNQRREKRETMPHPQIMRQRRERISGNRGGKTVRAEIS